jgi:hypothetical protein
MATNQKILDEAYPIIDRLAKARSTNGAFAYYEGCDVGQEVWCMCLEAMDKYDPKIGPIENFLVRHVQNRLINLKRDKYFRPGSDIPSSGFARTRMNLINALPFDSSDISEQDVVLCSTAVNMEPMEYILCNELLTYIQERLPDDMDEIFEELMSSDKVRDPLVEKVREKVFDILTEGERNVGCQK